MRIRLALFVVVVSLASGVALVAPPRLPAGALLPTGDSPLSLALVGGRAAVLARGPGGRADVFLVPVRVAPGGAVLAAGAPRNVTATRFAAEADLTRAGDLVSFSARVGDRDIATERLDLAGRTGSGRGPLERLAFAISGWQRTGDVRGLCRRRTTASESTAFCDADAGVDLFRWAVDQARYEVLGPTRLQRIEAVYFVAADALDDLLERLAPPEAHAAALGRTTSSPIPTGARLPPADLVPILSPPEPGEGRWLPRDPAFSPVSTDGRPLFWSTFVRPDRDRRQRAVVYLTAWDPAELELGMRAGTSEPRSPLGAIGDGRIPREDVDRLAAAFNGGFQTADGGYGMRVGGERWLEPIPWASTVAVTEDGRIGFGSWPAPGPDDDTRDAALPTYRQNLHPLVADGVLNPFGRRFWGGVPIGMHASQTNRTALCMTPKGLLVYGWGQALSGDTLARAMARAGCSYAMMLDMNFANTEFELYRVGRTLPSPGRALDADWEAEGRIPGRPDLAYRAQRMVRGMSRKGFPRYVDVDARDFMYLLRRKETIPPAAGWHAEPGRPPAGWTDGAAWRWHPAWARPAWTIDAESVPAPFGVTVDGKVLRPAVPGLPTLALYPKDGGVVARVGRWGEDLPAGATWLLQGERARPGEPAARIDEDGFLRLESGAGIGFADGLWLPIDPARLAMLPTERDAAFRLFPDTQPVRPRIWFADHWRRAQALGIWTDVDQDSVTAATDEER